MTAGTERSTRGPAPPAGMPGAEHRRSAPHGAAPAAAIPAPAPSRGGRGPAAAPRVPPPFPPPPRSRGAEGGQRPTCSRRRSGGKAGAALPGMARLVSGVLQMLSGRAAIQSANRGSFLPCDEAMPPYPDRSPTAAATARSSPPGPGPAPPARRRPVLAASPPPAAPPRPGPGSDAVCCSCGCRVAARRGRAVPEEGRGWRRELQPVPGNSGDEEPSQAGRWAAEFVPPLLSWHRIRLCRRLGRVTHLPSALIRDLSSASGTVVGTSTASSFPMQPLGTK